MAKHLGWRVYEDRGKHVGAAWDPAAGKYKSKRHDKASDAKKWAIHQHGLFTTGQDTVRRAPTKDLADSYLANIERRERSASHIHNLGVVLRGFQVAVPDLSHPSVRIQTEEWLERHKHLAPTTRNRMLVMAKALSKWAHRHGMIGKHTLALVEPAKVDDLIPPQFTVEELQKMVRAFGDPYHPRACVSIYAGLRISESGALTWEKIDLPGRQLDIIGKGRKQRMVPIHHELAAILQAHGPSAGPVFPKKKANAWQEFSGFLERIGLERRDRSPHGTRHSYAGVMTATGVPSTLLMHFMGHAGMETTAHYARLAQRYTSAVEGWPRGEFQLLLKATTPWPKPTPTTTAESEA